MYTFIIDLIPNTGPYTGLYNQRGSKFKVVGGVPFFISLICAIQDV